MRGVQKPAARVRLRWRPPAQGGRTAIPSGPSYAATAVFEIGGERETVPGWPATGEHFSILIEIVERDDVERTTDALIEFLAADEVADLVRSRTGFLILEGSRVVAETESIEPIESET